MLDKVKLALRINNTAYDDEINLLIAAAEKDLEYAGVSSSSIIPKNATEPTDNLVIQSIIFYCKANFGFDNSDSDRFAKSYDLVKQVLCLNYPSTTTTTTGA